MKKFLLSFSLLVFSFSLCTAQDTIFLLSRDTILSHVNKVGAKIKFTYFVSSSKSAAVKDTSRDTTYQVPANVMGSVNKTDVAYIHYANKKIEKFNDFSTSFAHQDTTGTYRMNTPQDEILLWTGEEIETNIIKFGPRIYVQNYHDLSDKRYYIKKSEVQSVHYANGRSINFIPRDTLQRRFFLSVDGGLSMPVGLGHSYSYGENSPLPNNFSTISENAGNGAHFDLSAGLRFCHIFNFIILGGEDMEPSLNSPNHQDYNFMQGLAGFGLSTNEAKHYFSLRFEWLAGICEANFPSFSSGTESINTQKDIYLPIGFMYASTNTNVLLSNGKGVENYVNLELKYAPKPTYDIHLNAGLLFANIKYSNASTYTQTEYGYNQQTQSSYIYSSSTQTNTNAITMPIAALQVNLGVAWHF